MVDTIKNSVVITTLFLLEVFLPDEADTLDGGGLAERVLIHSVGVALHTKLTILRQFDLYVQIAEEGLVGDVVIPVSYIAVDHEPINRL